MYGICETSDNTTLLAKELNCGNSNLPTVNITLLDLGDSTTETEHIINGGDSTVSPREKIEVQSEGIATVTRDHRHIEIGDKVMLSIEPNRVTSVQYDDFDRREWYYGRTLGKVISIEKDNKVKILLDIE